MKSISDKVKVGNLTLKNRFVRTATWEDQATPDGVATQELIDRYAELAAGGAGLIISGNATVDRNDNYFEGTMRLSDDLVIPSYRDLTKAVHDNGGVVFAQLALGAYFRKTPMGYQEISIDEMTVAEIEHTIEMFVNGGRIAMDSGFDGVEIHAAHFFLLSRSLSPAENHRTDEYGGSTENRARILTSIITRLRKDYPEMPISVRLNATDETPGGIDTEECLRISRLAIEAGADMIDVSGNNADHTKIHTTEQEGYFSHTAAFVAENIDVPVLDTGGIRSMEKINELLANTKISLFGMSRPFIRQPNLPNLFLGGVSDKAKCVSCNMCFQTPGHHCIFVIKGID